MTQRHAAARGTDADVVLSFPPQVGADCRVLVLGTIPSLASLALQQSYGHRHNLFWPFMGELFDAGPERPYAERIRRLHARGVGIWDVLARCERPGSLDSSIRVASEMPNDIPGLLHEHPTIAALAINGTKALSVYRRRIEPLVPSVRREALTVLALPSTSPANAAIPRAAKLQAWRGMLRFATPREPARRA